MHKKGSWDTSEARDAKDTIFQQIPCTIFLPRRDVFPELALYKSCQSLQEHTPLDTNSYTLS